MNSVRCTQSGPSPGNSIFSVTSKGEVCVFDSLAAENACLLEQDKSKKVEDASFSQNIPFHGRTLPLVHPLENSFPCGSSLFVTAKINENADRFSVNLNSGKISGNGNVVLHFNPRLSTSHVVLNDKQGGQWGMEEKQPLIVMLDDGNAVKAFNPGHSVQIIIQSDATFFQVSCMLQKANVQI